MKIRKLLNEIMLQKKMIEEKYMEEKKKEGGKLVYERNEGKGKMEKNMGKQMVEMEIENKIYEGMVKIEDNYNKEKMIDERYVIREEGKKMKLKMRKGVKFNEG